MLLSFEKSKKNLGDKMLAIGLMSGTSLDGVDASLVEIINDDKKTKYLEKYFIFVPYQEKVKKEKTKKICCHSLLFCKRYKNRGRFDWGNQKT